MRCLRADYARYNPAPHRSLEREDDGPGYRIGYAQTATEFFKGIAEGIECGDHVGRAAASASMSVHSAMMQYVRSPVLMMLTCCRPAQFRLHLLVGVEELLLAPWLHPEAYCVECGHAASPLILGLWQSTGN